MKDYEEQLLTSLRRDLNGLDGDAFILGGFYMGGRQLDALVLRNNGIYIIEAKSIQAPVHVTENNTFERTPHGSDGKPLDSSFKDQCYGQFYALVDWFREHGHNVLGREKAARIAWKYRQAQMLGQEYWRADSILLFWPEMHADTLVEVDRRHLKAFGYADAVRHIRNEPCPGVSLNLEEMRTMAQTLGLRRVSLCISAPTPVPAKTEQEQAQKDQPKVAPEQARPEDSTRERGEEATLPAPAVPKPSKATVDAETRRHRRGRRPKRCRRWWRAWIAAACAAVYAFRLRLAREHLARERERARREIDRIGRLERKLSGLTRRPRVAAL